MYKGCLRVKSSDKLLYIFDPHCKCFNGSQDYTYLWFVQIEDTNSIPSIVMKSYQVQDNKLKKITTRNNTNLEKGSL